jgi:DNA-directed RNA polymerase specialized sigma24 family protein
MTYAAERATLTHADRVALAESCWATIVVRQRLSTYTQEQELAVRRLPTVSAEACYGGDANQGPLKDAIAGHEAAPEQGALVDDLRTACRKLGKDGEALLLSAEGKTWRQIGSRFGLSRARIGQRIERGRQRLARKLGLTHTQEY